VPSVRPVPPAPVINHRRPAPARTWTPADLSSRVHSPWALDTWIGLRQPASSGSDAPHCTDCPGCFRPLGDCGRVLPLIQNNRPTPPEHSVWAQNLSGRWPKRGFPYHQAITARLIAEGTATFITGVLSIAAITPVRSVHRRVAGSEHTGMAGPASWAVPTSSSIHNCVNTRVDVFLAYGNPHKRPGPRAVRLRRL
jgi:hypothetical protein